MYTCVMQLDNYHLCLLSWLQLYVQILLQIIIFTIVYNSRIFVCNIYINIGLLLYLCTVTSLGYSPQCTLSVYLELPDFMYIVIINDHFNYGYSMNSFSQLVIVD